MFKDFKEDPILLLAFLTLFIGFIAIFISLYFEFKKLELTEQDYYNKFCPKYYDVSCDKIKIK
tara:strand:- start:439 stop:627 length:189 start_codon:yes stop_codon:yes gene_type:complete